ncbi:MAG: hypothetical protein SD837_12520 [Candidatus Electrothrix scaldis]|nr:MAG: hypothetical protein SD837_12520 [Candidatus Electrothrix sp. GW3-3]
MKIASHKVPALVFGVLIIFMALLMLGPRVPDNQQKENFIYNIDLPGPFGFSLNCDSPDFLFLAHNPWELLRKGNVRQDRPAFILLASAFAKIIPLSEQGKMARRVHIATRDRFAFYLPIYFFKYYASYILINVFILLGAFLFFSNLVFRERYCYFVQFSLAFLLIFNDVVKAFVWSPHTQMFNIMLPLFCLWCFIHVVDKSLFDRPFVFVLALLAGVGMTAYASFILVLPSIILPALVILVRQKELSMKKILYITLRSCIIGILVILPSALWYFYVISKTGSFYSHSTEAYHHVVWMKDAYQEGVMILLNKLFGNFSDLSVFAAKQSWILLLIIILMISSQADSSIQWKKIVRSTPFLGSVFILLIFLIFFSMVGMIVPRLAYTAVPPLIVLTAYFTQQFSCNKNTLTYRLIPFVIFFYGVYEIVKDGPYS